jgi:hypothetical protein
MSTTPVPWHFNIRVGLIFIVQSATLSTLAVTGCLSYIAYKAVKINKGAMRTWTISTHFHLYFLSLLFADLVQAIGGVMGVAWIVSARVEEGPLCVAQGLIKQVGDVGVALTSMAIAIHTLLVLAFKISPHRGTAYTVVGLIWVFIALNVGISLGTHRGYYGNTGYWCWITPHFSVQRIILEYFWLYLACFVNIVVYVFLFLVVKGVVVVQGGKIHIPPKKDRVAAQLASDRSKTFKEAGDVAMQLLYYPAVYIITVLPVAFARWFAFTGHQVPFGATAFASILFSSSGLLNVILFKVTRPKLLSNDDQAKTTSIRYAVHPSLNPLIARDSKVPRHSDLSDRSSDHTHSWKTSDPTRSLPKSPSAETIAGIEPAEGPQAV